MSELLEALPVLECARDAESPTLCATQATMWLPWIPIVPLSRMQLVAQVDLSGVNGPESTLAGLIGLPRYLHKAFLEREVVPDRVLRSNERILMRVAFTQCEKAFKPQNRAKKGMRYQSTQNRFGGGSRGSLSSTTT